MDRQVTSPTWGSPPPCKQTRSGKGKRNSPPPPESVCKLPRGWVLLILHLTGYPFLLAPVVQTLDNAIYRMGLARGVSFQTNPMHPCYLTHASTFFCLMETSQIKVGFGFRLHFFLKLHAIYNLNNVFINVRTLTLDQDNGVPFLRPTSQYREKKRCLLDSLILHLIYKVKENSSISFNFTISVIKRAKLSGEVQEL